MIHDRFTRRLVAAAVIMIAAAAHQTYLTDNDAYPSRGLDQTVHSYLGHTR